jgi:phosphoadenylyl-sulfate reductase (thioredoxin)
MPQDKLESEAEYVLKEAKALFKNPVILWAGGKDSTSTLHLAKHAFAKLGKIPFPVMFIDTGLKYRETYEFMEKIAKAWNLDFIKYRNEEAILKNVNPKTHSAFECCTLLKTEALKKAIKEYNFDAVIVSIRWDEEGIRGKEKHFSKRKDPPHVRVHPLLNWSEKDVWKYIRKYKVPYNPLYDRVEHGNLVYRSIGCYPCTKPVPKDSLSERAGRVQDKQEIMEDLRKLGYM